MDQSILDNLGAVQSDKYIKDMFILDLHYYVMNVLGVDVYFAQYDSSMCEDLRPKDLVEFFCKNKSKGAKVKMSMELLRYETDIVIQELQQLVNEIK